MEEFAGRRLPIEETGGHAETDVDIGQPLCHYFANWRNEACQRSVLRFRPRIQLIWFDRSIKCPKIVPFSPLTFEDLPDGRGFLQRYRMWPWYVLMCAGTSFGGVSDCLMAELMPE